MANGRPTENTLPPVAIAAAQAITSVIDALAIRGLKVDLPSLPGVSIASNEATNSLPVKPEGPSRTV